MITLSVCMIVKNEQSLLQRCLDSLAGIYDELIIVDTGSSDATKQIALKYTSSVFDYVWTDNFSAARNFSLSKATKEYIYCADADEVLDEENARRFQRLKQSLNPAVEVVEFAYHNPDPDLSATENYQTDYRPKLFRRLRRFEYEDPIHETLRFEPTVFRSDITVLHMPQSSHAGRDLAVLSRLAAGGIRMSKRLERMYARELILTGETPDFLAAERYFTAVYTGISESRDSQRVAACVLSRLCALRSDGDGLLSFAAPELADDPPAEVLCAFGDYFLAKNDIARAAAWYDAALNSQPELVVKASGETPLYGLSKCHEAAGNHELAAHFMRLAEGEKRH